MRQFRAKERGWSLPDECPVGAANLDERIDLPEPHQWREHYRCNPASAAAATCSRVAFAGDDEAYLCLRRLLGYGDSHAWIRANNWDAKETPWQDRWDGSLAR